MRLQISDCELQVPGYTLHLSAGSGLQVPDSRLHQAARSSTVFLPKELNPMKHISAYRWSFHLLDALAQAGVRHVVISPGSRSAPLTIAAADHPVLKTTLILDERSAGFFALGIGKYSAVPAALICTSGTAVANYLPSVVEARQSGVPMVVLSADRPPGLRGTGASQTIDQIKVFGDHAVWFHEAGEPSGSMTFSPLPTGEMNDLERLQLAGFQAVHASILRGGASHINLPFRKPLEPELPERAEVRKQWQERNPSEEPPADQPPADWSLTPKDSIHPGQIHPDQTPSTLTPSDPPGRSPRSDTCRPARTGNHTLECIETPALHRWPRPSTHLLPGGHPHRLPTTRPTARRTRFFAGRTLQFPRPQPIRHVYSPRRRNTLVRALDGSHQPEYQTYPNPRSDSFVWSSARFQIAAHGAATLDGNPSHPHCARG